MPTYIDGVPLIWNDNENLLSAIQKNISNFNKIKTSSIEDISAFNDGPFTGTSMLAKTHAFQNLLPGEVAGNYFQGIKLQESGNIKLVQDIGCDCGLVPNVSPVYMEANKKPGYQAGEDKLLGNVWVFSSTDQDKLNQCYQSTGMPKTNEAYVFYWNGKGTNRGILKAKLGKGLIEKIHQGISLMNLKDMHYFKNFDKDGNILLGFLKNPTLASEYPVLNAIVDVIGEIIAKLGGYVSSLIGSGFTYIGKLIQEHFSLPSKVWDSESEDYMFKELKEKALLPKKESLLQVLYINDKQIADIAEGIAGFVRTVHGIHPTYMTAQMGLAFTSIKSMALQFNSFLKIAVDGFYDTLDGEKNIKRAITGFIANLCGTWNGNIDFIAGIFVFLGMVGETPHNFWSNFTLDTFADYAKSIYRFITSDLITFLSALWESVCKLWKDLLAEGLDAFNTDKIFYSLSFAVVFVGTFFIPGLEGSHVSKALQYVKKLLPPKFLEELAAQSGKLNKLGNQVGAASKTLLDDFTKLASQGKSNIRKFFDEICEKIRKWFLKNVDEAKKMSDEVLSRFKKETEIDALFREGSEILGGYVVSEEVFLRYASFIYKKMGVALELVDRNSEKFAELYKHWYDKPVFATFHHKTFRNGRWGIILEGPAVYIFKGTHRLDTIEIVAYTVQHEMFHVKLWYKMTKEFPELATLYERVPTWLDEANVIAEFIKANKRNHGKWSDADILSDIKVLNDNFDKYDKWRQSIKKILGKEKIDIADLENWNISDYLKKI